MDIVEENLAKSQPTLPSTSLPLHLIPDFDPLIPPPAYFFLLLSKLHHRRPLRIQHIKLRHRTVSPVTPPHRQLIAPYLTLSLTTLHLLPLLYSPPLRRNLKIHSLPTHLETHLMCRYLLRGPTLHLISPWNATPIMDTSSSRHAQHPLLPPVYLVGALHSDKVSWLLLITFWSIISPMCLQESSLCDHLVLPLLSTPSSPRIT